MQTKTLDALLEIANKEITRLDFAESLDLIRKTESVIFDIATKNFKNFKYIVMYLGKSGNKILKDVSMKWKFDLEEMKSLTSEESSVVKISNLKKKI